VANGHPVACGNLAIVRKKRHDHLVKAVGSFHRNDVSDTPYIEPSGVWDVLLRDRSDGMEIWQIVFTNHNQGRYPDLIESLSSGRFRVLDRIRVQEVPSRILGQDLG
jgi:hypothetical protein